MWSGRHWSCSRFFDVRRRRILVSSIVLLCARSERTCILIFRCVASLVSEDAAALHEFHYPYDELVVSDIVSPLPYPPFKSDPYFRDAILALYLILNWKNQRQMFVGLN